VKQERFCSEENCSITLKEERIGQEKKEKDNQLEKAARNTKNPEYLVKFNLSIAEV
jgi:hypothetical protein